MKIKPKNMQQRICRSRNEISHSMRHILAKMMLWTFVIIVLLHQMRATDAAKFKGDTCTSKNTPGICKEWGECPVIKTLIENGEYTNRDVVNCGFDVREEIICCPVIRSETKIDTNAGDDKDRSSEPTTTPGPVKDFWLDLLETTTSSTTEVPDFWLDLIKPTTTTTTPTPLIVGGQKLNESSEFFDFNALLGNNQSGTSKRDSQENTADIRPNNIPHSQRLIAGNPNGHGNLNTGPANIDQWNFEQTGNNFNGRPGVANFHQGKGNNGHNNFPVNSNGNIGWGQLQFNRGQNMGRGPFNNNGRGHFNNGNGRNRQVMGIGNQNTAFVFPQNNMRPNNFFPQDNVQEHSPGKPVNNMQDQNPNIAFVNAHTNNNNNNNNDDDKKMDDLIRNVFETNRGADVLDVDKPQAPAIRSSEHVNYPQPHVWLKPQFNHNNREVEYVGVHAPNQIVPATDNQIDEAPSTSFIQQPVVVETWPSNQVQTQDVNPVQVVYENLLNSGMEIVKAQEYPADNGLNQYQQFGQQPTQVVLVQGSQPSPQFFQQPQFVYQESPVQPNFVQEISQQAPQIKSAAKEPRSTLPLDQNIEPTLIVQSPPTNILDPFKPFEFRPPADDGNTFIEDNNSLSPNPDTKSSTDRPAVRACRRIEKGLRPALTPHILGGVPADLGEFPHMVAIGYSRIGGNDRPPYDIRCGGTLIDKHFVLTAAHCVSERQNVPSIVRLGVVNFTDPLQMSAATELRIKRTYIHDEYLNPLIYNDIAILELERDVEYSEYVYPVCLYTNESDPETSIKLWVTGWGTVNTTTRSVSDILLKAPLHTTPLQNCNRSFAEYDRNRKIPSGIIRTQLCAEDKDQIKDACQGDSGGPLNMIVDESYKKYRLVGIISSGFSCASATPGLYTRVSSYLDFIEKIVWPNGGD